MTKLVVTVLWYSRKYFGRNFVLKQHILKVHEKVKKYSCEVCNKKFFDSAGLKYHTIKHHSLQSIEVKIKKEQFECHFCCKKYRTYPSLRLHIRTEHEEEQNYACEKCDCKFLRESDLKKHKEKHENVKNYFCDFCTERFASKFRLKTHLFKIHKDKNEVFSCKICRNKFWTYSNLEQHLQKFPSSSCTKKEIL